MRRYPGLPTMHFFFFHFSKYLCIDATDIDQRSQKLRHLYPGMGLQLGYSGFSRDQNNCDSSGMYELRSEHEGKYAWNAERHAKIVDAFFYICFHVCGRQKPEYLQLALHGWRRHYTGWYRSLGISFLHLRLTLASATCNNGEKWYLNEHNNLDLQNYASIWNNIHLKVIFCKHENENFLCQ